VTRRDRRGYARREWHKLRERNEALDCYVYARAAAAVLGLDRWGERHWRGREEQLGLAAEAAAAVAAAPPPPAGAPAAAAEPAAGPPPPADPWYRDERRAAVNPCTGRPLREWPRPIDPRRLRY
jgi:phage terminase large subunit GpA-like protein